MEGDRRGEQRNTGTKAALSTPAGLPLAGRVEGPATCLFTVLTKKEHSRGELTFKKNVKTQSCSNDD